MTGAGQARDPDDVSAEFPRQLFEFVNRLAIQWRKDSLESKKSLTETFPSSQPRSTTKIAFESMVWYKSFHVDTQGCETR